MKTFVCFCLFALVAIAWATTPQEKLREYSDACKPESGVTEETLNKARNHEDVDDPKLKAHALCILKKSGFIGDNGHLNVDTIKEKFNKASNNAEGVEKLVNKCAVNKATPEETASEFFKCVHHAREEAKAH